MKILKVFNKIDENIIKKYPFQWIIGWHIFLPIIAILFLFAIIIGYIAPTRIYYYSNNSLVYSRVFIGFISFMVFIFFVIRQIKFNSFRIHHHIPFSNYISTFFSFWLIIFILSFISFIPYQINTWHVQNEVKSITNNIEKDVEILYKGSAFFYSDSFNNKAFHSEFINKKNNGGNHIVNDKTNTKIKYDILFEKDSVIINKVSNDFGYPYYKNKIFPKKIKKDEAFKYIEDFIIVAKKYNIKLSETNLKEVYKKRQNFNNNKKQNYFSLFRLENKNSYHFDSNKYQSMMSSYKRKFSEEFDFKIILGFLIFSITITILLLIFISIPIADFGFSILISVLLMVASGVTITIMSIFNASKGDFRIMLYIEILIIYLIAFIGDSTNRIIQIFKIVSHYVFPVLLFLIILDVDHENVFTKNEFQYFSIFYILAIIFSVFIFKKIYKNYRLLPK